MSENTQITPQQAEAQFAAEEFASQVSALTQRIAKHRVYEAQLVQEVERLRTQVAAGEATISALQTELDADPAEDAEAH